MIKKINLALLIFSSLTMHAIADTTVVKYKECAALPAEVGNMDKPTACQSASSSLTLMITDESIIGFEDDSLFFESLTIDGKDYSLDRLGDPQYETASFPKIPASGKYAIIGVDIKGLPFGSLSKINGVGHINLLTADKLIKGEKINVTNPTDFGLKTLGPVEIISPTAVSKAEKGTKASEFSIYLSGFSMAEEGALTLLVKGYDFSVSKLEVFEGKQKLQNQTSMTLRDIREMNFIGYKGGSVTIKIDYWKDAKIKKKTIKF